MSALNTVCNLKMLHDLLVKQIITFTKNNHDKVVCHQIVNMFKVIKIYKCFPVSALTWLCDVIRRLYNLETLCKTFCMSF